MECNGKDGMANGGDGLEEARPASVELLMPSFPVCGTACGSGNPSPSRCPRGGSPLGQSTSGTMSQHAPSVLVLNREDTSGGQTNNAQRNGSTTKKGESTEAFSMIQNLDGHY